MKRQFATRLFARHFSFALVSLLVTAGVVGFAGRFGAAPGGGVLLIDHGRVGRFHSPAEVAAGASPDWSSLFPY